MRTVFADAFYYFALLNSRDNGHASAIEFTASFDGQMVTTAWVLTELADGLADPVNRGQVVEFIEHQRADADVSIFQATEELFDEGYELYAARSDKSWSLTDCISFTVMRREGITNALTGDHDYEQAGFRCLLKSSSP